MNRECRYDPSTERYDVCDGHRCHCDDPPTVKAGPYRLVGGERLWRVCDKGETGTATTINGEQVVQVGLILNEAEGSRLITALWLSAENEQRVVKETQRLLADMGVARELREGGR